jgi:hypothetical protein
MRKQPDGVEGGWQQGTGQHGAAGGGPNKGRTRHRLGSQQSTTHKGGGWVMAAGWDRNKKRKAKRGE